MNLFLLNISFSRVVLNVQIYNCSLYIMVFHISQDDFIIYTSEFKDKINNFIYVSEV